MDNLVTELATEVQHKFYGKYRGFVVDNADPERRGRLRVSVPSVLGSEATGWALPCLPYGGLADQGWFAVPDADAQVWVEFEEGELSRPIWTGTFWQAAGDPPAEGAAPDAPTTRVLKTASGHVLQFDDEPDAERIRLVHPAGAQVTVDEKGSITLVDAAGATVALDADAKEVLVEDANGNSMLLSSSGTTVADGNGNTLELAASGVTVKAQKVTVDAGQVLLGGAGGEPVIKGQSFLTLFATHMHPTAMGPSGPPVPQGETSSLSMKVMSA